MAFNWIFILIASIIVVFFLILCGLCIFCFVQNHKRRRNSNHHMSKIGRACRSPLIIESFRCSLVVDEKATNRHRIDSEVRTRAHVHDVRSSLPSFSASPTKLFSYPEQQLHSSFSKIAEIQKLDQFKDKQSNRLIVTTTSSAAAAAAAAAHGHCSSNASGSSDPILLSNPNSSSLSGSDQLTVTDFYPSTNPTDLSYKSYTHAAELPLSSAQTDLLWTQSQYGSYGFPFYTATSNIHEIVSNKPVKEDSAESGYSTPSKAHYQSKKTVYEVVV